MKPQILSHMMAHWRWPVSALLCILCMASLPTKSHAESTGVMKRIPIVSYHPGQLQKDVLNSFVEVPYADCFYAKKQGDSIQYLWRTDKYRKYRNTLDYDTIIAKMHLSEIQSKALIDNDSVFVFTPHNQYRMRPDLVYCIGFVKNDDIWFVYQDQVVDFPTLTAMMYGSQSNYVDFHLKDTRATLMKGELFEFKTQQDALDFLRDNHKFRAFAGQGKEAIVDAYMRLAETAVHLTDSEKARTKKRLMAEYLLTDLVYSDFRRGKDVPLFDITRLPVFYGQGKREAIESVVDADDARLHNAVDLIMPTISNIDSEGRYRSDTDCYEVIFDRVFNSQSVSNP